MKSFPFSVEQVALIAAAALGFAGSTLAFRRALDASGDHRWMSAAFALLVVSYIPYLSLLGHSISATVVATSMLSQTFVLLVGFTFYNEPLTAIRIIGLVAALVATIAFSLPATVKT